MWFHDLKWNEWDKYLYYIEYRRNPINDYPIESNFLRACTLIFGHGFTCEYVPDIIKREVDIQQRK